MALTINTNVASLNAQRNLSRSQGMLATSLQRLSTGLRINSAKDDAAGLAIAQRFTTQIRGLNQAVRNASDGISLAQTTESALAELTNNLQRIRELAVQSANASNSASDRKALNEEVQQRIAEIDRIAKQTSFNGVKVLNGSAETVRFQVGANVGETISVSLDTDVRASALGSVVTLVGDGFTNAAGEDNTLTFKDADGADIGTVSIAGGASQQEVVDAINSANLEGISAFVITDDAGAEQIEVVSSVGDVSVTESAATDKSGLVGATAADPISLSSASIESVVNANVTIAQIDSALTAVSSFRADLGAIQNRFESTIVNLQTVSENLAASRGRIQDADFAAETAALTKAQILQQAGVSVLAQANAQPQLALSLLQQ